MNPREYSRDKPTEPGWYWLLNEADGDDAELICRIDWPGTITEEGGEPDGLVASWMMAPGQSGLLHESRWSPLCLWAGPIEKPVFGTIQSLRNEAEPI